MDKVSRIGFLTGLSTGGMVLTIRAFRGFPVCTDQKLNAKYPEITNGDLAVEIDKFYRTAANVPLPVHVPVILTFLKANGATKEQLEKYRAASLKAYVK